MIDQSQIPLVGPLIKRGWADILQFRPLTEHPHVALVLTRRGRLAGTLPADGERALSDYLALPFDYYEVDMRERMLTIEQRLESLDAGCGFIALVKLFYQVERPERVVFGPEKMLDEIEETITQLIRGIGKSYGVERGLALQEHLREVIFYSDALRARLDMSGLLLRRVDVVVELDQQGYAHLDELRPYISEHQFTFTFVIESLDPEHSFDVQVGGAYRLTLRTPDEMLLATAETTLREKVEGLLKRIGITFTAADYNAAARAMHDGLRHDSLFQTELSTAQLELVRSTVQITPDRYMLTAAPPEAIEEEEEEGLPPWGTLGSAFGREDLTSTFPSADETPYINPFGSAFPTTESAAASPPAGPYWTSEPTDDHTPDTDTQDNVQMPDWVQEPAASATPQTQAEEQAPVWSSTGEAEKSDGELPPWAELAAAFAHEEQAAVEPPAQTPPAHTAKEKAAAKPAQTTGPTIETPINTAPKPAQPATPSSEGEVNEEMIERWMNLLLSDGPAVFKVRALELIDRPERLPEIMKSLTTHRGALEHVEETVYQRALVQVLRLRADVRAVAPAWSPSSSGGQPTSEQAAQGAGSAAASSQPPADTEEKGQEDTPDWLRLRQVWNKDGGAA